MIIVWKFKIQQPYPKLAANQNYLILPNPRMVEPKLSNYKCSVKTAFMQMNGWF